MNKFQDTLNTITPKQLFLIDSFGALLTAFMLGIVLARLESFFGMPRDILYILSLIACVFALYSFICYRFTPVNWPLFLRIIAIANLAYCILTISCIIYLYQLLTIWGLLYFLLECIVIVVLVSIEWRKAATKG
ncbi:MAG: hypothetical protein MI974_33310 [Chitinophagales bacterium]|nr:hypothetical protein [Chitinophagales bacterium]